MKFLDCTTEKGRENLERLYKEMTGKDFTPPQEVEWESLEEMEKMMQEVPNYTISVQGRR